MTLAALFAQVPPPANPFGQPAPAPLPLPSPFPMPEPRASLLETAATAILPVLGYLLVLPAIWFVFRRTWRALDVEAHEHQRAVLAEGRYDFRPLVLFVTTAAVLTLQDYYGGRNFYADYIRPYLLRVQLGDDTMPFGLGDYINLAMYNELYGYGWWTFTRIFGYVVIPFTVWKIFFRQDSLLDMGLRTRGLLKHAWIYAVCLVPVVVAVLIVASGPEFGNYYPFYRRASRSWMDLAIWEAMYFAQFLGLEIFFRGFWLSGLRKSMGSAAIFTMCVPYCMIHFTKPYLETIGAVVAGIFLGSLAMRTKSIYSGFMVHITIALLMDVMALYHRNALPTTWMPAPPVPF